MLVLFTDDFKLYMKIKLLADCQLLHNDTVVIWVMVLS